MSFSSVRDQVGFGSCIGVEGEGSMGSDRTWDRVDRTHTYVKDVRGGWVGTILFVVRWQLHEIIL